MKKISHLLIKNEFAADIDNVLGEGSTGKVFKGYNLKTNQEVAVKMIDMQTIDNEVATYLL